MRKTIATATFFGLMIPLLASAQATTTVDTSSSCDQLTDPIALAACIGSTTPATILPIVPIETNQINPTYAPSPIDALTSFFQELSGKTTPNTFQYQNVLTGKEDVGTNSSAVKDLENALYQNPTTNFIIAPGTTASTSPEIQALIAEKIHLVQDLLTKIEAIKTATSASSTTPMNIGASDLVDQSFGRTLQIGSNGDDVRKLQEFLAQDTAIYPEAQITGYFGPLTQAAVGRWQLAHHIVSSESADGFGIFGPKTRAAIMEHINSGSTAASTSSNTSIESANSSETSITQPTQDNTSTQSNESIDPPSLDDPMTALVTEASTLNDSITPITDSPPASESQTVNTWPLESETIINTLPPEGLPIGTEPPDWFGLGWF
ncbi:peptidoglycan-binding protein [Candidatus Kaiserbacteria bacterium]|nr:peptidoglycan-binding protein [Candidatus Kaiserbacteria bacterium]